MTEKEKVQSNEERAIPPKSQTGNLTVEKMP